MGNAKYFSVLLVGDAGTGKTTVSATAPAPVLFIDVDNKLHKMDNMQAKLASGQVIQWAVSEPLSGVTLTRLATTDPTPGKKTTFPRATGYLKIAEMIDKLVATQCVVDGKKIETVVLDSYTTMDEHLRRLLTSVNQSNTMSLPLYGALLSNFEEVNNTLLRLPANIIMICHNKVEKDELTGKITYAPLINGQMSGKIGKDFEEVYAMEKVVTAGVAKYQMLTVGDGMRACRTSRTFFFLAISPIRPSA